ncbi:MAG: DUF5618 family protein [Deltaproteobacteria bacterium]|nr:DUF5618 family protein [Deltaproteobacteria bacterium]
MSEPLRYLNNAKETLSKSKIEDNIYLDDKYVKSACGVAYLGVLKAIDEYLQKRGLLKKELPRSVDAYRGALKKYVSAHNGKLLRQFDALYHELHIAGYYRGDLLHTDMVKTAIRQAKEFIDKVRRSHN